jgi:predicted transposase YbfD/YdcC
MKIEVSVGEIVDKLTILTLKKKYITTETQLANIQTEYLYLLDIVFMELNISKRDFNELLAINEELWHIEDDIREKERKGEFDEVFIELARAVYITNDERAVVKRRINDHYGSEFKEEKSYAKY